jgi:hypothetical protein
MEDKYSERPSHWVSPSANGALYARQTDRRNTVARILVAFGAVGWFATAVLHLKDYPKDTAKLSALSTPLQAAVRTIFLMVGWDWIVIAIIALLAAFTQTTLRRVLVLFCGVAGFVQAALALAVMGVFLGTELMFPAAVLLILGGLLLRSGGTPCPPSNDDTTG